MTGNIIHAKQALNEWKMNGECSLWPLMCTLAAMAEQWPDHQITCRAEEKREERKSKPVKR